MAPPFWGVVEHEERLKLGPLPVAAWRLSALAGLPLERWKQSLWASFCKPKDTCLVGNGRWGVTQEGGKNGNIRVEATSPQIGKVDICPLTAREPQRPSNNHDIASLLSTVSFTNEKHKGVFYANENTALSLCLCSLQLVSAEIYPTVSPTLPWYEKMT